MLRVQAFLDVHPDRLERGSPSHLLWAADPPRNSPNHATNGTPQRSGYSDGTIDDARPYQALFVEHSRAVDSLALFKAGRDGPERPIGERATQVSSQVAARARVKLHLSSRAGEWVEEAATA